MKIYKSVTINIESGDKIAEESFEYYGPIAKCKGDVKSETVQSPEARQALTAIMPVLERIGLTGEHGGVIPEGLLRGWGSLSPSTLYEVPRMPIEQLQGYYGGVVPSAQGLMPTAENIGNIAPRIKEAVAQPYLEAIGQATEQFGGGMGSARGGLSGAGANILQESMGQMIPQYTQQLWGMVQPGLQSEWQGQLAANLAKAQTGVQAKQAEWGADVAVRQAPFGVATEIAGGTMPTTVGGTTK